MALYEVSFSTFAGIALGASHYFARVTWYDAEGEYHSENVTFKERSRKFGTSITLDSRHFKDEKTARRAAIKWFKKRRVKGKDVLVEGSLGSTSCNPSRVLVGPKSFFKEARALYKKSEANYERRPIGFDRLIDGLLQDRLCKEWMRLIDRFEPYGSKYAKEGK